MNTAIRDVAGAAIVPKVMRSFRFRWLFFAAAAYYGLRLMSKRGIFPEQADAALNVIDNGIVALKNQLGLGHDALGSSRRPVVACVEMCP